VPRQAKRITTPKKEPDLVFDHTQSNIMSALPMTSEDMLEMAKIVRLNSDYTLNSQRIENLYKEAKKDDKFLIYLIFLLCS
jgi:hypothetical protein